MFLLQHAAKLIIGGNLVPPAILKCLAGVGAQVEDGDDLGVGHGIEGRGKVVVGRLSVEHAMAAGDGNAASLAHGQFSSADSCADSTELYFFSSSISCC